MSATKHYITTAIGILLMFGFGYLPPISTMSPMGMNIFGIFLGLIFLWSCQGLLWPSLLGIFAIQLSGFAPLPVLMSKSFGDPVVVILFLTMILFAAVQQSGLTKYIARWFLTRKMINGRPYLFSFIFMFTTYICGFVIGALPSLLLMWGILYGVLQTIGYTKGEKYTTHMVTGTGFAVLCAQAAKPFLGSALVMTGAYEKVAGVLINYPKYMLVGIILSTACIIAYTLVMKFLLRPDVSKLSQISTDFFDKDPLPPINGQQKVMVWVLILFFAGVILPSIVPMSIPGIATLNRISLVGICLVLLVALSVIRVDGKPVINIKEVATKGVVWDIYFLVAIAMLISSALSAPGMGITEMFTSVLEPFIGQFSGITFYIVLMVSCVAITQFANNAVMAVLLMPFVGIFTVQAGLSFEGVATIMCHMLHIAFVTPAASPYGAMILANADWVDQRDASKNALVIVVTCLITYIILGPFILNAIY